MVSVPHEETGRLRRTKTALRGAIACVCLAYVVWHFSRHTGDLKLLVGIPWLIIAAILGAQALFLVLHSYRFGVVFEKSGGKSLSFWAWLRLSVFGLVLSRVLPQMGTVYQGVNLKKKHGVSYTRYAAGKLTFIWTDMILNFAAALVVTWMYGRDLRVGGAPVVVILPAFLAVVVVFPLLLNVLLRPLASRAGRLSGFCMKCSEILGIMIENVRDARFLVRVMLAGLAIFTVVTVNILLCFRGMNIALSLPAAALYYALFKVSDYVNITPGNLGVREVVLGALSEALGMGMSQGILVSILRRVLAEIVGVVFAAGLWVLDSLFAKRGIASGAS